LIEKGERGEREMSMCAHRKSQRIEKGTNQRPYLFRKRKAESNLSRERPEQRDMILEAGKGKEDHFEGWESRQERGGAHRRKPLDLRSQERLGRFRHRNIVVRKVRKLINEKGGNVATRNNGR